MDVSDLNIRTGSETVLDITSAVAEFVAGRGDGFVNVFVPHSTAGVALMETGSGSEADLSDALRRILPRDERYAHCHGAKGHGADHLLPVFVSPSMVIPVRGGTMLIGTWQSIVLIDTNTDNPNRTVRVSFLVDHAEPS